MKKILLLLLSITTLTALSAFSYTYKLSDFLAAQTYNDRINYLDGVTDVGSSQSLEDFKYVYIVLSGISLGTPEQKTQALNNFNAKRDLFDLMQKMHVIYRSSMANKNEEMFNVWKEHKNKYINESNRKDFPMSWAYWSTMKMIFSDAQRKEMQTFVNNVIIANNIITIADISSWLKDYILKMDRQLFTSDELITLYKVILKNTETTNETAEFLGYVKSQLNSLQ